MAPLRKLQHPAGGITAIVTVAVLHGMIHGYSIFLSPLNEQLYRYFAVDSITAITAMKSTYLAVYAFGNLFFGVFTNRISARHTLALGMIVNGIAVAAFGQVGHGGIIRMHVLWAVAALGGSVYHPVANVLITRLYPRNKGMVLGVTGTGAAVGFAFAPLLTELLSGLLAFEWQQVALFFGFAGIVIGMLSWLFIPGTDHFEPLQRPSRKHSDTEADRTRKRRGAMVLLAVIAVACLREFSMWSVLDISDFFFAAMVTGSSGTGFYLFLLYVPGIFVKPIIGVFSDRLGRKRLAVFALIIYGLSILSGSVAGSFALIPVYLLMGIGMSATIPSIEAIVADGTSDRNRGIVFGVFVTAAIGVGSLGPLISGIALDAMGGTLTAFRTWFLLLGILPLIGAATLAAIRLPSGNERTP